MYQSISLDKSCFFYKNPHILRNNVKLSYTTQLHTNIYLPSAFPSLSVMYDLKYTNAFASAGVISFEGVSIRPIKLAKNTVGHHAQTALW